ncbi:MAG TPA: hypothetical protein VF177_20935 [Anaerolineae bacterium]
MTPETLYTIWWISIVIFLVVTGVVGLLLALVLRTTNNILDVAGDIWTAGKLVANNTIHIPLLRDTNRIAAAILATAKEIVGGAAAIEQHAEGCPGCPECVLSQ